MTKKIRTFWPVGQGLFCSERFVGIDGITNAVVIYDCGSTRNIQWSVLEERLIPQSAAIKRIDLLFISHFHEDHIRGVQYLMEHYEIGAVLMPVITTSVLAESFIFNVIQSNNVNSNSNTLLIGLTDGRLGKKLVNIEYNVEGVPFIKEDRTLVSGKNL